MSERQEQRWRLALGGDADEELGTPRGPAAEIDRALAMLYEPPGGDAAARRGGKDGSSPAVARWLGDIRRYFPSPVVRVMQRDALERLNLREMLLEPEMLQNIEPDVSMVANLISLSQVIPARTRETARMVVRRVVDDLMQRLEEPMRAAVSGALDRSRRNRRPRYPEIDWHRTIRANLRHYQPELSTVVPETLAGFGRKARRPQREVILAVDQSGSMAASLVFAGIFGAVMASLPAVSTKLVLFDTSVVDMTERLEDPVDLLFGAQLGGGTDINAALAYCRSLIREPHNTILVLISDLYEGGVEANLLREAAELVDSGVQLIALLALSDEGAPSFDRALASKLAALGVPSFACTPDQFPELMAAAIRRDDVGVWAGSRGLATSLPER